ncbi:MAG: DUF885 domain-containing protein [Acetobacter papayae]
MLSDITLPNRAGRPAQPHAKHQTRKRTGIRTSLMAGAAMALLATSMAHADTAATLDTLEKAHFEAEWADSPVSATQLGIHTSDSLLDNTSLAAINARTDRLHAERTALAALDVSALPPDRQDDRDILLGEIDLSLIENEQVQPFLHNPDFYVNLATDGLYSLVDRNFAPVGDRLRAVIARERQIPGMLATGEAQLTHVPDIFIEIAQEDLAGALSFVEQVIPAAFDAIPDRKARAELRASTKSALAALNAYQRYLGTLKPDGSFVLGADTLSAMLATEGVHQPLEQVIAAGRDQLRHDQAALDDAARAVNPLHPERALDNLRRDHTFPDGLIPLVQNQLVDAQRFVVAHKLVTLPAMTLPVVTSTPAFERSLITAATDWPGPFERVATTSYYYITPIALGSNADSIEEAMGNANTPTMLDTTIHEAMPGHFVQGLYLRANPQWSLTRKSAQSYATTEGWAHYVEQMMVEQGFHGATPRLHLAQLQDALLRDCRFLVAFGLHAQNMSVQDATALMQHECYQSPTAAYKEARRGTMDPGYYSYLLGKLMILHLRADMQKTAGKDFSLHAFHDGLLSRGLVPMRYIRREMTGHDDPVL